jgi:hypothetical protein
MIGDYGISRFIGLTMTGNAGTMYFKINYLIFFKIIYFIYYLLFIYLFIYFKYCIYYWTINHLNEPTNPTNEQMNE